MTTVHFKRGMHFELPFQGEIAITVKVALYQGHPEHIWPDLLGE
jgi:hypothetical protein